MKMNTKTNQLVIAAVIVLVLVALLYWGVGGGPIQNLVTDNGVTTTPNGESTTPSQPSGSTAPQFSGSTAASVVSVVASIPEGSRFYGMLSSTGVGASLSSSGTYTIFVPTNTAFTRLPKGTIENLSAAGLKRLVQHHIVSGRKIDADEVDSGMIEALSKEMLNFEVRDSDNSVFVGSALVMKEYKAKNGVVYLVGSVLLPPEPRGY